jgi:hypothetical protein
MTDPERGEVFAALAELARRYPHWRVGQLVANVAGWADAEIWDAEDEQLLAAARAHLASIARRVPDNGPPAQPPHPAGEQSRQVG